MRGSDTRTSAATTKVPTSISRAVRTPRVSVTAAPPTMPTTWAIWLIVPLRASTGPCSSAGTASPSSAAWTPTKAVRQAPSSAAATSAVPKVGNSATAPMTAAPPRPSPARATRRGTPSSSAPPQVAVATLSSALAA